MEYDWERKHVLPSIHTLDYVHEEVRGSEVLGTD